MRSDDERWTATKLLYVSSFTTRGVQPPTGSDLSVNIELWLDALNVAKVPTNRFRSLLAQCMATGGDYPVSVSAICGEWRKEVAAMPAKTLQELDIEQHRDLKALPAPSAETRSRRAFVLLGERMRADKGNVACECNKPAVLSKGDFDWVCATNVCSFAWPVADTLNAPHSNAAGPLAFGLGGVGAMTPDNARNDADGAATAIKSGSDARIEMTDAELLRELSNRCGFGVGKVQAQTALSFARRLEKVAPVSLWTAQVARQEWTRFSAKAAA